MKKVPPVVFRSNSIQLTTGAEQLQMERLLDQSYLAINLTVVKSSCSQFNVSSPLCRSCRFYSTFHQEQKLHLTCQTWFTAFGVDLRDQIIRFMRDGVQIGTSFLQLWNARKSHVQAVKVPATNSFDRPAKDRKSRFYTGIPTVEV